MGAGDRFYQIRMRNREAYWGDIGNLLHIEGILIGGAGGWALLRVPDAPETDDGRKFYGSHALTAEEWSEWLRLSDDPKVLVMPQKAFHRKLRFQISGFVQQKIWLADGLVCRYCGVQMGRAPLTIDHFVPLELGGANDESNYLTACKRCNKDKGSEDPRSFCERRKLSYDDIVAYLQNRTI